MPVISPKLRIPFLIGGPEAPGPFPPIPSPVSKSSPFTFPAYDLMTLAPLDPLPYTGVTFGRQLNAAGPFQGSLLMTDPGLRELRWLLSSKPAHTALFVDYLGSLIWGGIVWGRKPKKSTKQMLITASEFGSYFAKRLQAFDYTETWAGAKEEDATKIAKRIVEDALAVEVAGMKAGNILGGIKVVIHGSNPNKVSASYPGTQLQTVESIVSTLAGMGFTEGFDYSFDCEYLPGTKTPKVTLNIWYPRQGRLAGETGIVIQSQDLIDDEYPEDGTAQANSVTITGSGSGGIQPISGIAEEVLVEGYPLLEKMVSHPQVNDQAVLANIAIDELRRTAWPPIAPPLILPVPLPGAEGEVDSTKLGFGSFQLGDDFEWRIDPVAASMNADPRWPKGMASEWRIQGWTCTATVKPTLQLDVGIPPVSTLIPPPPPTE